jgi:DNA-binding NarL/FixJ family response regulator
VEHVANPPTRILLAISPMLGDIVRRLVEDEIDLEIVGEVGDADEIAAPAAAVAADVVIVRADRQRLAEELDRIASAAAPRVLAVAGEGRSAYLYSLRPARIELGALSHDRLVAALRPAAAGGVP